MCVCRVSGSVSGPRPPQSGGHRPAPSNCCTDVCLCRRPSVCWPIERTDASPAAVQFVLGSINPWSTIHFLAYTLVRRQYYSDRTNKKSNSSFRWKYVGPIYFGVRWTNAPLKYVGHWLDPKEWSECLYPALACKPLNLFLSNLYYGSKLRQKKLFRKINPFSDRKPLKISVK